jgi:hypothetical protein
MNKRRTGRPLARRLSGFMLTEDEIAEMQRTDRDLGFLFWGGLGGLLVGLLVGRTLR